ncbi:MAG: DUF6516 family protein [Bacteroidia bacterium]|nr:DUF6516 family protein [Bacteroidia bacterium]
MINDYFRKLKETINQFDSSISDQSTTEKAYSEKKGFIEGEILFTDDSRLDFAEVKDTDHESKIKYRYHYMNNENELIFRYDNAPHYPELESFPHHKHTQDGVYPCSEPEIDNVLSEIEPLVIEKENNK